MKLYSYTTKDLQHVLQILIQAEQLGVTDIRFVREKLHKHMYQVKASRNRKDSIKIPCPSCEKGIMGNIDSGDSGVSVVECSICRYSEIIQMGS